MRATLKRPMRTPFDRARGLVWDRSVDGRRVAPLLDFATAGTHTRASAATWEHSPGIVVVSPSGARRISARGYVTEGARTNLQTRSHEMDTAWTTTGTVTADSATDPASTTQGDNYAGDGVARDDITKAIAGGSSGHIGSVWLKSDMTTAAHFRFGSGAGANQLGTDLTISPSWARYIVNQVGPSTNPSQLLLPALTGGAVDTSIGTTDDMDIWGVQGELSAFATSYMATSGATATRVADVLDITDVPTQMRSGRFKFSFYPEFTNGELTTHAANMFLMSFGADVASIHLLPTGVLRVFSGAANADSTALTFSKDQRIEVEVDHDADTFTVSGATTGDGTTAFTSATWTGDLHVGDNNANSLPFFGEISNPLPA